MIVSPRVPAPVIGEPEIDIPVGTVSATEVTVPVVKPRRAVVVESHSIFDGEVDEDTRIYLSVPVAKPDIVVAPLKYAR